MLSGPPTGGGRWGPTGPRRLVALESVLLRFSVVEFRAAYTIDCTGRRPSPGRRLDLMRAVMLESP